MQLQPLGDRVVARQVKAETKTAAGILLPHSSGDKPPIGEVVSVGKDVKEVKVGDKVLFSKGDYKLFDEFKHENEEYVILKEAAISAIVKG